jgi:hypothetical protein
MQREPPNLDSNKVRLMIELAEIDLTIEKAAEAASQHFWHRKSAVKRLA